MPIIKGGNRDDTLTGSSLADLISGMMKTPVFGAIIALVACPPARTVQLNPVPVAPDRARSRVTIRS